MPGLDERTKRFARDGAPANCYPFQKTQSPARPVPLTWRKFTHGRVRKTSPSNRLPQWSASLTILATVVSSFILIGTLSEVIRVSRKSSPGWRLNSFPYPRLSRVRHPNRSLTVVTRKTNSCYIKHRLADPIYPKVLFDWRVPQCSRAKWRQTEPRR